MSYLNGMLGKVRIGGSPTVVPVTKWQVDPKADEFDATTTETGTIADCVLGHVEVRVTLEMLVDPAAGPYNTFPVGTTLTTLKLYINDTTGSFWSIPTLKVTGTPHETPVRGMQKVTITGRGTGSVIAPV